MYIAYRVQVQDISTKLFSLEEIARVKEYT
jgi:hypothetical protein